MVSLPTRAIDEIISLASNRHNKLPSPTGVADVFDFANADDISPTTQNKVAGSSVECLEYATASSTTYPQSSASSLTALRHFPNEQIAHQGINECASRGVMHHVLNKTLTIVEFCHRMTIHPADVAMALECFVDFDAKTGAWYCSFPSGKVADEIVGDEEMNYSGDEMNDEEDWQQSDGNGSDEEVEDEDEDNNINEDEEDEEEEGNGNDVNVDTMQNSSNTSSNNNDSNSNKFDTAFPPLENPVKALSNSEFDKTMIQPILEEMRACLPMKKGVIDALKSAMYAFLVSKLT